MSNDVKPVDLAAIRARADEGSVRDVNAVLYEDVPAMADEIGRLRARVVDLEGRLNVMPWRVD